MYQSDPVYLPDALWNDEFKCVANENAMKPYVTIAIVIFSVVALVHGLRLLFGWTVMVQDETIPMWVSVVGVVIPAGLAILLYREMKS